VLGYAGVGVGVDVEEYLEVPRRCDAASVRAEVAT